MIFDLHEKSSTFDQPLQTLFFFASLQFPHSSLKLSKRATIKLHLKIFTISFQPLLQFSQKKKKKKTNPLNLIVTPEFSQRTNSTTLCTQNFTTFIKPSTQTSSLPQLPIFPPLSRSYHTLLAPSPSLPHFLTSPRFIHPSKRERNPSPSSFPYKKKKKRRSNRKKSVSWRTRSLSFATRTDAKKCRKATVRGPPLPRFSTRRAAEARVAISEARDETSGLIIARNARGATGNRFVATICGGRQAEEVGGRGRKGDRRRAGRGGARV